MCKPGITERSTTIFRTKTIELTPVFVSSQTEIEQLSNSAAALAGSVLSKFELDIADLEQAASDQETVAVLAQDQADVLIEQRDLALELSEAYYAAARGLRAIVAPVSI